jgi:hypothetical protein
MPGTTVRAQCGEAHHGFDDAGRRNEVADRPLESGHGRHVVAEHPQQRRSFRAIGSARAVRVRDDHADVRGTQAGVIERVADGALGPVAIGTDCEQALRFRGVTAAQHFGQHLRTALARRILGLDHQRAGAFAELAAVALRIERTQRPGGKEPHVVVVQHHLRLDGRLVAHRHDTVGLAVAHGAIRLDHREQPPTLWLVMQALVPLSPYLMPMCPSTLFGSVRRATSGSRYWRARARRRRVVASPRSSAGNSRTGSRSCRRPSRR